ncbi:thermonuclease family protein [Nocardioides sp. TF02-7]|uniref:thermonuclease family protein n=1 Tax=Nocardioides sp. TF02-7 TaxID=2917724 RepID=UPI001F060667|nr:thermonuclease family protein [Nocardioides sp. TF02-7]UMG93548.1 thermonuclease family protein [Nocardioides sp. TF02-7]
MPTLTSRNRTFAALTTVVALGLAGCATGGAAEVGRDVEASAPTYVVTYVVDGDTLELGNGERVRLVGIDTPERGECGYEKARDRLAGLVEGERVTLGESDEDRDGYGRLLRYVDLDGVDAGLELLEAGLARARYDSRDGYGAHPRERRYIRADRGSPRLRCPRPPRTFVDTGDDGDTSDDADRGGGDTAPGCEPGYKPCVPVYPPDVDCGDVAGPITVTGSDPHGLDGEGDGIACE